MYSKLLTEGLLDEILNSVFPETFQIHITVMNQYLQDKTERARENSEKRSRELNFQILYIFIGN